MVRCEVPPGTTWTKVYEESGSSESVRPEAGWHVGMEKEGADAVVESAKDAFGPTVLL